tara:strand:- start:1671 stop:1838 length:168 start_codon:yes stop_codon:yes gene_type:complete
MEIYQMTPITPTTNPLGTAEYCPNCGKSYFARKFWILRNKNWVMAESQAPTSVNQ